MARSSKSLPKVVPYMWDAVNKAYVPMEGGTYGLQVHCPSYILKYDEAGSGLTYVGRALAGTSVASAGWQIYRIDDSAAPDFDILYADGVTTYTKVWNSRSGYTYS